MSKLRAKIEGLNKLVGAFLFKTADGVEINDIFWVIGLASATYGMAQWSVPAAWILCGAVLFWMGVKS